MGEVTVATPEREASLFATNLGKGAESSRYKKDRKVYDSVVRYSHGAPQEWKLEVGALR